MKSKFNELVLANMRQMHASGATIVELLEYLVFSLKLKKTSRLIAIAYVKECLQLDLKDAMIVGGWSFFEGGTWDSKTLVENFDSLT